MEKQRKPKEKKQGGPQGLTPAEVQVVGSVLVSCGPYSETLPLAGMSVEQVRKRFADKFDIAPDAVALVDGQFVTDEKALILNANSLLTFSKQAGEKGADVVTKKKPSLGLEIDGETVTATSPEGATASMPLNKWLDAVASPVLTTGDFILPDGIKTLQTRGAVTILVHETSPQLYNLKWIAKGSSRPYGPGTKYRQIDISLPYVLTFAVFQEQGKDKIHLTDLNECFFLNKPVKSLEDKDICYPALLNVSKYPEPKGRPLAWICTQYLDRTAFNVPDRNQYMRKGLQELVRTLIASGFNLSSEHHEGESWFGATVKAKVDKRIETIETWSENSKKDPLFVLEVPWIKTGFSVKDICERIFDNMGLGAKKIKNADDLAKLVFSKGN